MRFPLIKFPKRSVYIDDKGAFLDQIRMTMPSKFSRQFIESPRLAIETLKQEATHWQDIQNLLADDAASGEGAGLAALYASTYFNDWRRFHLTSVLVVDYSMPSMNGLDMLRKLGPWPGRKILLTGAADATVAIQGFNEGLIQKFLPKDTPNLNEQIRKINDEMHENVCAHLGQLLYNTLSRPQVELLSNPTVVSGLEMQIEDLEWVEYVTVGHPFGLLGMSNSGPLQWLQIETEETLSELAALALDFGMDEKDAREIRLGASLINTELMVQFNDTRTPKLLEAIEVCRSPGVFASVTDLDCTVLSRSAYGIEDITTPDEEIRSILRNCLEAFNHYKTLSESGAAQGSPIANLLASSSRSSAQAAVDRLAIISALSVDHQKAASEALNSMALPDALRSQIELAFDTKRMSQDQSKSSEA